MMQMVKRFIAHFSEPDFRETEIGGWVQWADYKALADELAIVTKDRDTLVKMTGLTIPEVARRLKRLRKGASSQSSVKP